MLVQISLALLYFRVWLPFFFNRNDSRLDCSNFGLDDNYPQVAFQTDLSILSWKLQSENENDIYTSNYWPIIGKLKNNDGHIIIIIIYCEFEKVLIQNIKWYEVIKNRVSKIIFILQGWITCLSDMFIVCSKTSQLTTWLQPRNFNALKIEKMKQNCFNIKEKHTCLSDDIKYIRYFTWSCEGTMVGVISPLIYGGDEIIEFEFYFWINFCFWIRYHF